MRGQLPIAQIVLPPVISIKDPELKNEFWVWYDNLHPEEKSKLQKAPWDVAETIFMERKDET